MGKNLFLSCVRFFKGLKSCVASTLIILFCLGVAFVLGLFACGLIVGIAKRGMH